MDAGATANLVRRVLDDCDRYLLRRFGDASGTDRMTAVTLRCLQGHTTQWDPDTEDFPLDGCDFITATSSDGESVAYCGARYGAIQEGQRYIEITHQDFGKRYESPPLTREEKDIYGKLGKAIASQISDIVSPDAETTTNERGGMQSHVPVRFDLIDGKAMFAMAAVLHEGAEKYAPGNWRLIPTRDHLNHALMHIFAYLSGDRTDEHLSHALCRITFANAVEIDPEAGPERDE